MSGPPSEVLAIVPARGGSKGIPGKNLAMVAGKPLISYILLAALDAKSIRRLVVSTDDEEIAAVSIDMGAEVVERPAEISGDTASSEDALLHVLEYLERSEGYKPDIVAFLQATAPLTTAADIDGTVGMVTSGQANSALAVMPFHYFLWRTDADGSANGINHDENTRALRQQRDPEYLECGSVYVFEAARFVQTKHRFFGKVGTHVVDPSHRLEIDEQGDLELASLLLARRRHEENVRYLPFRPAALVLDFDGVFTDNMAVVDEDGKESVSVNRSDGMGISMLKSYGVPILVLSTEPNPVVGARCEKLQIECRQGLSDKLSELLAWTDQNRLDIDNVVYVGNDVNDLPCLQAAGISVVVADAHPATHVAANMVLSRPGGHGAIREITDLMIEAMNRNDRGHD